MNPPIVLAQISDTHALASPDHRFLGQNHAANLRATLDLLAARGVDPDAYVLTGDLANNAEADSYRTLKPVVESLRATGKPVLLVVGNHDDRVHLRAILEGH
ncbi:MAG: metallophosphoesterase, partial [Dehalococcoidia bacterium]|nr:metallophosphoesterase [Dehalococcoidia bacterium]